MRMSIGYLEPLVFFRVTFVHASFIIQHPAGVELATSGYAVQCLIHWATAAGLPLQVQKLIFNCKARSQGPRIFSRWRPLVRASLKCLRPVSIMLATATPQSPAMKRPLKNLELYNYPYRQT